MNSFLSAPLFDWQSENVTAELYECRQHADLEGKLEGAKDASKLAHVLLWLGRDGRHIYNAWEEDASKKTLVAFWVYLAKHVSPSSNFWLSRINLSRWRQQADESIDSYMTKLRGRWTLVRKGTSCRCAHSITCTPINVIDRTCNRAVPAYQYTTVAPRRNTGSSN